MQTIQKESILKKAIDTFSCIPMHGERFIFHGKYESHQLIISEKKGCELVDFIISSLRHWDSFEYANANEFKDDLDSCNFEAIGKNEAKKRYDQIFKKENQNTESFKKEKKNPPSIDYFGEILSAYSIVDLWNYKSVVLETPSMWIACQYDTAE